MIRLTLTCLLLISVPAFAQRTNAIPDYNWGNKLFTGNDEVPPKVIVHDFGTLPKGTEKHYTFKMTNIYAIPIQIAEPKPTCGCISVVTWTGKMDPAQTGIIEVKIDTKRVEGPKQVNLPVLISGVNPKTGEAFHAKAELELRAVSRADTTVAPGAFQFGIVPSGTSPSQVVNITYSGQTPNWKVVEFGWDKSLFDVTIAPFAARGAVMGYQLKATVKNSAPVGSFEGQEVVLKTTDPTNPILKINLTGKVQSPLSTYPEIVRLDKTAVGKSIEKNVLVQADKLFKIAKIDGAGEGVDVEFRSVAPAKTHVIKVTFNPTKAGLVKKSLVIKTEEGETVTLPIEAPTVE